MHRQMILLLLLTLVVVGKASADPVRIALRPQSRVSVPIVTVADVAQLSGGDEVLRARIGRLDVALARDAGDQQQLSREQIQIRLLLAGVSPENFELTGASEAQVTRAATGGDPALVLAAVATAIANALHAAPDDLEVRLLQPLPDKLIPEDVSPESLRIEPRLPAVVQPGRVQVNLQMLIDDQPLRSWPLVLDVAIYREVARTTRLVARGEKFTRQNVAAERMRLSGPQATLSLDDVLDRASQRALGPGVAVQVHDVAATGRDTPLLVRPRDVVRVTARKGKLTIALHAAEAMDGGREGDLIRVRNTSSNKIITGRVVGRNALEVEL